MPVLPGLILILSLLAACSGGRGGTEGITLPTGSVAPSPPSPSPSPSPLALEPQPIRDARLSGQYEVRLFITDNTYASTPRKNQRRWTFEPRCASGACDVLLTGRILFNEGLEDRKKAGASGRFQVRLARFAKSYGGTLTDFFGSCGDVPVKDDWTFRIKVERAKYVGEEWLATRWSGTWTRGGDPGQVNACLPAKLRAVIRGVLA